MAVVIRLKRVGAKKDAAFRIVVADSRRARDGRFIEQLGYYDPQPREAQYRVDIERAQHWLGVGAQASDQVRSLLKKAGVTMPSRPAKAPKAKAEGAPKAKQAKGQKKKEASAREKARRTRKREKRSERRTVASKKKAAGKALPAEAVAAS